MLRMLGRETHQQPLADGQLRRWFAPGEQFIIVSKIRKDKYGVDTCVVHNLTLGTSEIFKASFVQEASVLVADPGEAQTSAN